MTSSEKIAEALFQLLINAKDEDFNALTGAVEEFKSKYHRSYADVKRQPFARNILDAIAEAKIYNEQMAA